MFQRFDPQAVTTTPAAFLAVALLAVVVWLGLAAASSIVTDYGFTSPGSRTTWWSGAGCWSAARPTCLARLQVVRIEESLLRRALGLASIRIQSAGRTSAADQSAGGWPSRSCSACRSTGSLTSWWRGCRLCRGCSPRRPRPGGR